MLFVKCCMSSGCAGADRELSGGGNTMALFADAKVMCENIVQPLPWGLIAQ